MVMIAIWSLKSNFGMGTGQEYFQRFRMRTRMLFKIIGLNEVAANLNRHSGVRVRFPL